MAYFNQLAEEIKEKVMEILKGKVEKYNKSSDEIIDDWLNRHNFDLSNAEWIEEAENIEGEDLF